MRSFLLLPVVLAGCGAAATTQTSGSSEPAPAAPAHAHDATPPPTPSTAPAHAHGGGRVTEPFRQEHAKLRTHLEHVDALVASIATAAPGARRDAQQKVVGFLTEHILPHAAWEEAVLYPAVDRRASQGEPFTATMRFEHTVVHRWTEELRATTGDPVRFVHKADRVLGLITAHFEAEEQVLLPVLDRTMTPAEYERELGAGAHHGAAEHKETP
jgi:hemerythrin-like domain-containing protein